jgi:hypothetical protein
MIWSKKKVDADARSYLEKIEELGNNSSFNQDRHGLSRTLETLFEEVLQQSGKKQPVLQEIDQISKIYAHSEFINNLFHDELTRIKDKCLTNFVASSSSISSEESPFDNTTTQIYAAAPSPSRSSSSGLNQPRSALHLSPAASGAPGAERSKKSHSSPQEQSSTSPRPGIELLRGPLKRPDRAISKVTFSLGAAVAIFLFDAPCRFTVVIRGSSVTFLTAFVASWFATR